MGSFLDLIFNYYMGRELCSFYSSLHILNSDIFYLSKNIWLIVGYDFGGNIICVSFIFINFYKIMYYLFLIFYFYFKGYK